MRTLFKNIVVFLIIILAAIPLSLAQEEKSLKDMSQEEYEKYEKASDEALKDVHELAKMAEKMRVFRQSNDMAYGFPSDLNKLKKMQAATESFADNELKEIEDFYKSLQEKYNANSANNLNIAMGKVINPFPQSKKNFQWPANELEQNIVWFNGFKPELNTALEEAEQEAKATAAEQNKAKELTDFPEDIYSGSDLSDIKKQMRKALLGSVIKNENEVTGIAVISDWKEGVYSDSKQPYRKINGTVLFADTDKDGISRYTSFVFIANKTNGDWQSLKYKAFCNGCLEGWAEAGSGSMSSAGDGFLGSLLWLVLVLANILGGLLAAKTILNKYHPLIEKTTDFLAPYAIQIGLTALVAAILSFVISLLGLRLLYAVIPQVTAALLAVILAYDYIQSKAKGKMKDQMENSRVMVKQVNVYAQTIGLAALVVGILYLFLNGSLYFI